MPEQPDNYESTEEDIKMIVEATTGKLVKPANLGAGVASMRRRIANLEAEKIKLLDLIDADADKSLNITRSSQRRPRHHPRTTRRLRSSTQGKN